MSASAAQQPSSKSSPKEERVRVAVRVRPFNQREEARGCSRVVDMDGALTTIVNPQDPTDKKTFTFDHSFWSFDGFKEDEATGRAIPDLQHPRGKQYAGQERLFEALGKSMLNDAFEGYNTTLFSYGQTGAGKSYSIMGYGPNEGIVPQFCHHIFESISERIKSNPSIQYEVYLSMLEIYNETVYDLLNMPAKTGRGLKVREHPKKGFYAEGLKNFKVNNYPEIERLVGQGTLNRTVTSTNMNATSSRAHTIVTLSLVQKKKNPDGESVTTSIVNIVDLAGSERVAKVGNTSGDRFREGVSINQSLQCLGHCIHALADSSNSSSTLSASTTSTTGSSSPVGRPNNAPPGSGSNNANNNKGPRVPYRDSVLTKLLMNALGGNSKTIMIASISPADDNYEETLSTLRYADRAKQIKTRATVNEDPTEKAIRDLKAENQRLKSLLSKGNVDPQWLKSHSVSVKSNNPLALKEAKKKWENDLKTQMAKIDQEMEGIRSDKQLDKSLLTQSSIDASEMLKPKPEENPSGPHLQNVNVDPMLDGRWKHYLSKGATLIGKMTAEGSSGTTIEMIGPGMKDKHAEITVEDDKVILRPLAPNGRVLINGVQAQMSQTYQLQPYDRLVFGATQLWLFRYPTKERPMTASGINKNPSINYDFFLNEMASKSGLDAEMSTDKSRSSTTTTATKTVQHQKKVSVIQQELIGLLPCVEEANGISAELDKRVKFEIVLVSPQILMSGSGPEERNLRSQVYIKMKNLDSGCEYLWPREKFFNRFDLMKELYRRYQLQLYGEEDPEEYSDENTPLARISKENDPFVESPDTVVIIGVARIFLQSLAYLVEIKEEVKVTDLHGSPIGTMDIAIQPRADDKGRPLSSSEVVDAPEQLIGRKVYFEFRIAGCRALPPKFKDIHCKYRFYGDKSENVTDSLVHAPQMKFEHRRMIRFEPATKELVDFLNNGSAVVEVHGRYLMDSINNQANFAGNNLNASMAASLNSSRLIMKSDRRVFSRTAELMADMQANSTSGLQPMNGQKQELLAELQLLKETHIRLQQRLDFLRHLVDRCAANGQEAIPLGLIDAALNVNSQEQARRLIQQLQAEVGGDWAEWDQSGSKEQKSSLCTIS